MKNKIELKKFVIYSFFIIITINLIFLILNFYQYKTYTDTFNRKIDNIVSKLNKQYPNLKTVDIIEILNSDESSDNYIFREYGIDIKNESLVLENDNYFKKFLLERYLYNIKFKKRYTIYGTSLKKMKRDHKHLFYVENNYLTERQILKKTFDK